MRDLLFLALVVGAVPVILARPVLGLSLYLGINVIRPEMLFWGGGSGNYVFKVFYGALLLGAAIKWGALNWRQLGNRPVLLMFLLLAAVYLSIALSPLPPAERSFYYAAELAKVFGIAALIFLLLQAPEDIVWLQKMLIGCFTILAIWGIQQSLLGNSRLEGLGGSAWGDSNGIAANFVLFLPVPLALALQHKGRARWLAFAAAALILVVIVCTKSRAGFLGILTSLLAFGYFARQVKGVLVASTFMALLALPFATEAYMERLQTMESSESLDGSARSRLILWQAGLMVFADNPMLGTGFLTYPEAKMKYEFQFLNLEEDFRAWVFRTEAKKVTHNAYIQVLSDLGLAGFVPFGLLCLGGLSAGLFARSQLNGADPESDRARHGRLLAAMAAGFTGFAVCILTIDAVLAPFLYWQLALIWLLRRSFVTPVTMRPSYVL